MFALRSAQLCARSMSPRVYAAMQHAQPAQHCRRTRYPGGAASHRTLKLSAASQSATKQESSKGSISSQEGWGKEKGMEYFEKACGDIVLTSDQASVFGELTSSMHKAALVSLAIGVSQIASGGVEYFMNGQISSFWSTTATMLHVFGIASMSYIASRSFSGIREAAEAGKNCLPPLMVACSRLSLVLSQVGVMSTATAAITLVSATAEWTPLLQYVSAGVAGLMAVRLTAALYLMSSFGQKGSVVSTISSIQSKAGRESKLEKGAVWLAASNMLQYPFVLAFAQARSHNTPKEDRPKDKDPSLAAIDESLLDPNVPTGITASAKEEEEKLERHAKSNSSGQGKGHDEEVHGNDEENKDTQSHESQRSSSGEHHQGNSSQAHQEDDQAGEGWSEEDEERHKDPEVLAVEQLHTRRTERDYQFNEGEQLVMQMMTDEMRMAGYNQMSYACSVLLMAVAHVGTAQYMSALLLLPLLRDVGGTAQVLFVTTKQIETSVLSSGRDITTMLVGMGQDKGLAGLFTRIANLGKGVVIGSTVGILWQLRPLLGLG